jgi:hypothetical protein
MTEKQYEDTDAPDGSSAEFRMAAKQERGVKWLG